jgi:hypothetical protein
MPAALLCSCGNSATHTRRLGAIAGCPALLTAMPGPPFPHSPASTRMRPRRPPLFRSLSPRHQVIFLFKTNAGHRPIPVSPLPLSFMPEPPEPHVAFPGQPPCSSPEHRGPINRRDLAGATALLPFHGALPSEPLLSQPRPSLTSLSPSDLQGASPIIGDHRRPPVSSEHT